MPKATTKRGGKVERRRGKKDPNAPKRGLSAYMFFANEQRENVREENPGISFGMYPFGPLKASQSSRLLTS